MFVVLLTNRVHAAKAQRPAKIIADVRSDLSDAAVLAVVDGPNPVLAMPASFRADDQAGWTKPKPVRCTKATKGRTARSKRARVSCSSARTVKAKKPAKSRSSKSVKAKSSKSASAKKKATTKKSTASKSKTSRTAKSG
jgi:hypothetical protein